MIDFIHTFKSLYLWNRCLSNSTRLFKLITALYLSILPIIQSALGVKQYKITNKPNHGWLHTRSFCLQTHPCELLKSRKELATAAPPTINKQTNKKYPPQPSTYQNHTQEYHQQPKPQCASNLVIVRPLQTTNYQCSTAPSQLLQHSRLGAQSSLVDCTSCRGGDAFLAAFRCSHHVSSSDGSTG